jgi:undecaprenyl diphosphate synthase
MAERKIPQHVAIIMDGNGRWAQKRDRPRIYGHVRGCRRVLDIIREADAVGVKALTLFAFSTENWHRPVQEVSVLFRLLKKWLIREQKELMDKNIRVRAIGNIERLPKEARDILMSTIEKSARNTGLQLTLALSYGGREEIVMATRHWARLAAEGRVKPEDITEHMFASSLSTADIGDPDLLIRTSGEERISNFLLYQLAYAELYFTDVMWPDFSREEFRRAIGLFQNRERRFGLTTAQLSLQ